MFRLVWYDKGADGAFRYLYGNEELYCDNKMEEKALHTLTHSTMGRLEGGCPLRCGSSQLRTKLL